MSRQELKAREKVTQKNTRDGLVLRNESTGEDIRVSKREADIDLRSKPPEGEPFSQTGKRVKPVVQEPFNRLRYDKPDSPVEQPQLPQGQKPPEYSPQSDIVVPQPADTLPENTPAAEPLPYTPTSGGKHDPAAPHGHRIKPGTPASKPKRYKQGAKTQSPELNSSTALEPARQAKLQFSQNEAVPETAQIHRDRKLNRAQSQAGRAAERLEIARDNLPAKKKLRKVGVPDEKTGGIKQRLQFERTPISQGEHIKGATALRPVKAAGNALMINAHRKLYQVEHENVGVKAAHRAEMVAEGGVRTALRFHKTAPYRNVAKLERTAQKKTVNLAYQQTLSQNPKLKSNIVSRAFQKRKIKKDYAKAAREAQKAAKRAKKAGEQTYKAAKNVVMTIVRHPKAVAVIVLIGLLLYAIMSLVSAFGSLGSGGLGSIAASTYLAGDGEMLGAEAVYSELEAALQYELDNYSRLHPGYDEYVFERDDIWHDPYVLISILSALHEGEWTLTGVQGILATLFMQQYTLTESTSVEVRYRTETVIVIDPVTHVATEVEYEVAYNYYIRTVTLVNFNLSHLPIYIMGESGLSRYAMYMMTLGNRPDLFPVGTYPNASYYRECWRYDVPREYLADPVFAAIIQEAEKWIGMPYVWGGYSPVTSFDCSGFVSWVINQSGWDVGRLGARGLYGVCTPVSASDAKPGDLIFFHSTYRTETPGITHVGIYVGDGVMIHAGNPIGYASIDTPYWQAHLYGYGRLN